MEIWFKIGAHEYSTSCTRTSIRKTKCFPSKSLCQGKPSRTVEAVLNGFPHSATCVGRTFSQGGRLGKPFLATLIALYSIPLRHSLGGWVGRVSNKHNFKACKLVPYLSKFLSEKSQCIFYATFEDLIQNRNGFEMKSSFAF